MNEDGFMPYKPGSGRLADRVLARVEGPDEWTAKDLRAAKRLKIKHAISHLWHKVKRAFGKKPTRS